MRTLEVLLKVAKARADDLARAAAHVQVERDRLLALVATAEARTAGELERAAGDALLLPHLPAFQARSRREAGRLQGELEKVEGELASARELLAAAFLEQARFEEVIRRAELADRKTLAQRAQAALDEAASQRAARGG